MTAFLRSPACLIINVKHERHEARETHIFLQPAGGCDLEQLLSCLTYYALSVWMKNFVSTNYLVIFISSVPFWPHGFGLYMLS